MKYFNLIHSIKSIASSLEVVHNPVLKPSQSPKQCQTRKQRHKLHSAGPDKKRLKGKEEQSSDRLLGQGLDEGLLSTPERQQEGGRIRGTVLRPPLIDIQQTVAFCPHYQQGCCHWVMLPGTQASYASVSTAARLQLLLSARLQLHIHSFLNICMCHSHFCSLYQIIQSSALSGLSLASPFAGEQLCFPHPAVTSKDSQSVSRRSSNSILPLDEAMARILYFLSHGKGSKHKPQMAELGPCFGEIQLCSELES